MFLRRLLSAKIHGAIVTDAHTEYLGSITIDSKLMKAAGIHPLEQVEVWDLDNGERLSTYCLPGEPGTGVVQLNGAAARKVSKGDRIIIASFVFVDAPPPGGRSVKVVFPDEGNRPARVFEYAVRMEGTDWDCEFREVPQPC